MKEHFENLLKAIQKVINGQLDIELGQFITEELEAIWKKINK